MARGISILEIQDQGLEDEKQIHEALFRLEKELEIPLVATNDSHYLCGEDSHAHDVMLCVQTGAKIHDKERFRFDSDQFFVKSADEMGRLFPDSPAVLQRTMEIAERCNLKLHAVDNPFPEFAVPEGHTIDSYFEEVCRAGLKKRLETAVRQLELRGVLRAQPHEYEARLEYRDRNHQADEVLGVLPDCVGLHQVCAGQWDSGGAGARIGDGVAGGVCDGDYEYRSAAERRCCLSGF